MEDNARKRISDRVLIEILVRHKTTLINDQDSKDKMQVDINGIINNFVKKTGRTVKRMRIKETGGKYKLLLEVS